MLTWCVGGVCSEGGSGHTKSGSVAMLMIGVVGGGGARVRVC